MFLILTIHDETKEQSTLKFKAHFDLIYYMVTRKYQLDLLKSI